MADREKARLAELTALLVEGLIEQCHPDAKEEDLQFFAAFYTPECAADARQIINATSEYLFG